MSDNQQPSLEERKCKKCGETKPLSEFAIVYSERSRGKNYRQHTCLVCYRKHVAANEKKRRQADPERYRSYNRKHWARHGEVKRKTKKESHQKLKAQVFAAYGGFRCVCCGETEPSMLTIDHVNNDGAEHRKRLGLGKLKQTKPDSATFYHWLRKNGYPAGFQVLCYNCNISKHRNGGVCAHELFREGSTTIPSTGVGPSGPKRMAPFK